MTLRHNIILSMRFKKELIDQFVDQKRMTKVKFCIESGISYHQLKKMCEQDEDVIVECAWLVARRLGVNVEDLFGE